MRSEHGAGDRPALPVDRLGQLARGVGDDLDDIVLANPVTVGCQTPNAFPTLVDRLGGAGRARSSCMACKAASKRWAIQGPVIRMTAGAASGIPRRERGTERTAGSFRPFLEVTPNPT